MVGSDGEAKVITSNRLMFKEPDIGYLTSAGSVGQIFLLASVQPVIAFGDVIYHEYRFNLKQKKAFSIRSEASITILKVLGQVAFDDFMNPAIQTIFNSINDIIMEIRYTAEQGDGALRSAVVEAIRGLAT